jgi:hypothetical protein
MRRVDPQLRYGRVLLVARDWQRQTGHFRLGPVKGGSETLQVSKSRGAD